MLITPGLCLMLSTAFRRLPTLEKILSALGGLSFEIYLVHLLLINVVNNRLPLEGVQWLAWAAASMVGAVGLRATIQFLIRRL